MVNLSSHQLHVFLAAAQTLNYTQAAQQLDITQPSVSQHIQALEEHFKLPLFVRCGRNMELTDAGLTLIPLAREMVSISAQIEEVMASLQGKVHGHLVVGCSTPTGRYILPKILASFHHQHPHVRITCQVASQEECLLLLAEGKVHLVLTTNPPFFQDGEFHQFALEQIDLITPLGHAWEKRAHVEPQELGEVDFILPDRDSEMYKIIREALEEIDISTSKLRTLISPGSLEAIALSVKEGLGVGFVPRLVVSRLVPKQVASVKIHGLEITRNIFIGRSTHRPSSSAQEAFWKFIIDPDNPIIQPIL